MNFRTTIMLGVALSVQLCASACSTPGPTSDPVEQAFSLSREAVRTGIDEGFDESERRDLFVVRARLNPCRCAAPRFEIYAHGRWTRVFLEGDDSLLTELDERLSRRDDALELDSFALEGAIDGEESTKQGVSYPVFEVEELGPVGDETK